MPDTEPTWAVAICPACDEGMCPHCDGTNTNCTTCNGTDLCPSCNGEAEEIIEGLENAS